MRKRLFTSRRDRNQKPKMPTSHQNIDWKSHPIIIAAGSTAATIVLLTGLFTQVILPTQTARLDIELLKKTELITNLSNENQKQTSLIKAKDAQIGLLNSEIKKLEGALLASNTANMFSNGSPYPNGFGEVRIGSSLQELLTNYEKQQIADPNHADYINVTVKNSPIKDIVYYLSDDRKSVTHISFGLGWDSHYPNDFLRNKLIESLGRPKDNPRPNYYLWQIPNKWNVLMSGDDDHFVVMRDDEILATWPGKL